jgi:hypothetical protein
MFRYSDHCNGGAIALHRIDSRSSSKGQSPSSNTVVKKARSFKYLERINYFALQSGTVLNLKSNTARAPGTAGV